MRQYPKPLGKLINGVQASRNRRKKPRRDWHFIFFSLDDKEAGALAQAITEAKQTMKYCSVCGNLTDRDPCGICTDQNRRQDVICVVENPRDVMAMERIKEFDGLYHVLHGAISPMDGIGPEDINLKQLIVRLQNSRGKRADSCNQSQY